jgi:hypothetical protein
VVARDLSPQRGPDLDLDPDLPSPPFAVNRLILAKTRPTRPPKRSTTRIKRRCPRMKGLLRRE